MIQSVLDDVQRDARTIGRRSGRHIFRLCAIVVCAVAASVSDVTPHSVDPHDLHPHEFPLLSMEELLNMEITTVSKKSERLSDAAAAIYVITSEDIRRSGATNIPQALRLAPGLQVAQIDANNYAVSARGFSGQFANKLLVLIDGRSVYTQTFSGVIWGAQDMMLQDVERIEVIRGPGATLWGANAVNGVINIITRSSRDTQGAIITGGSGNEEHGMGAVRYGGRMSNGLTYRSYVKYRKIDDPSDLSGGGTGNDWQNIVGGFRLDHSLDGDDELTIQGDIFDQDGSATFEIPDITRPNSIDTRLGIEQLGGNLLARWSREDDDSAASMQIYYDRLEQTSDVVAFSTDTVDLEWQHRFTLNQANEIVWGLGYRYINDRYENAEGLAFDPRTRNTRLISAFAEDEITVVPDRLHLTLGTKLEYNSFTDFEYQPNIRLHYRATDRQTVWGAVSRAVRTPSRADHDIIVINKVIVPAGGPAPVTLAMTFGDDNFESEELTAYELGYRFIPFEDLSVDIAGFYNDYDGLRTFSLNPTPTGSPANQPIIFGAFSENGMDGETYGAEIAVKWLTTQWWTLHFSYSYLDIQLHAGSDLDESMASELEGFDPEQQWYVRSIMNLTDTIDLDVILRYVDNLPEFDIRNYLGLDIRVAWRLKHDLEVAVVGQNLLDGHHREFDPEILTTLESQTDRSVYATVTWSF